MSILDQALQLYDTPAVGGTGSTQPYTIASTAINPPAPVQCLTCYVTGPNNSGSYIQSIQVTFTDGSSGSAGGSPTGNPYRFYFQDGEALAQCTLYTVPTSDGRVALSFTTDAGRSFTAGDTSAAATQLASLAGSQIYGLSGMDGSAVDTISLKVSLPITEIQVYDLDYDIENVTQSFVTPIALDTVTLTNDTTTTQTVSMSRSFQTASSSSWTFTGGLKIGVKTTIEAGIPFVAKGAVELSAEVSFGIAYGSTYTTTQTFLYVAQAAVQSGQQVTAQVVATQSQLDVDYTGTLQVWYINGTNKIFPLSGTYTGISTYDVNVNYAQPETPAAVEARRAQQIAAAASSGKPRRRPGPDGVLRFAGAPAAAEAGPQALAAVPA
ncbi:MAG: ETX/MTX2 family pore-forming toxin [Armatimonadetes bacterium]|nr:ETX/MTX2 family pore-forming toxin [Armatimonadota bacterium]